MRSPSAVLAFFRSLQRRNRVARKLDFHVLRYPELNAVIFESYYCTVNPARSDDLIPSFEVIDHLLKLLLAASGGQKNDEVKDADNDQ